MSEQPPSPAADSQAFEQQRLMHDRTYDVLKWDPASTEFDLSQMQGRMVEGPIASLAPLRIEGNSALLLSLQVGPEKTINIWGNVDKDGVVAEDLLTVSDETYSPAAHEANPGLGVRAIALSVDPNRGNPTTLKIGRDQPSGKRFKLPQSVSREHAEVTLFSDGMLRVEDAQSTFGTKVLNKNR